MRFWLLVPLLAMGLVGCQSPPVRDQTAMNTIRDVMEQGELDAQKRTPMPPPEVSAALLPQLGLQMGGVQAEPEVRFDVNVIDAPTREFLMSLVDGTPYNMVVHPRVEGALSLSLKNVTIPEVMRVLRDVYGYEYEQTSAGFYVLPVRMQSRVYQINYLNVKRQGNSEMRVSSGRISVSGSTDTLDSTTVVTESEADFWGEVRAALDALVTGSDGQSVVVSPQSGLVVVRAMPPQLREVERYLQSIQATMQRQVILEAKIIEVELNDGFQSGIDWGVFANSDDGLTFSNNASLAGSSVAQSFNGVFSSVVAAGSFNAFIDLLQSQGNVQVLSSPRVATVNNQKAVIKVGKDEFFVTDVSSTSTVTGTSTTSAPDVTLTPFFSGIALDVTPQIDHRGGVTLHIHPSVSEVVDQSKTFTVDDRSQTLPLAQSRVRESDSVVYAQSGQIVVIGGLMEESTTESTSAPPGVGDLPFLGAAFRHTQQASRKSELVILLKPLVINNPSDWGAPISDTAQRFTDMDRGFHYGGKPEIFGTAAER